MKKLLILTVLLCSFLGFSQEKNYQLSSHILDITTGKGATGVTVLLSKYDLKKDSWKVIATEKTDDNGRIKNFLPYENKNQGIYKLTFQTKPYFTLQNKDTFYPFVEVSFEILDEQHYHVPITLTPYGYSTYRGN
ncbi:hydroxyisourate hydrolase [Flavobacterium sp.]